MIELCKYTSLQQNWFYQYWTDELTCIIIHVCTFIHIAPLHVYIPIESYEIFCIVTMVTLIIMINIISIGIYVINLLPEGYTPINWSPCIPSRTLGTIFFVIHRSVYLWIFKGSPISCYFCKEFITLNWRLTRRRVLKCIIANCTGSLRAV